VRKATKVRKAFKISALQLLIDKTGNALEAFT
jgi:hypothetical protein